MINCPNMLVCTLIGEGVHLTEAGVVSLFSWAIFLLQLLFPKQTLALLLKEVY